MADKQEKLEIVVEDPVESQEQGEIAQQSPWKFYFLFCIWVATLVCNRGSIKWLWEGIHLAVIDTLMMVQLTCITLRSWLYIILWGIPKNTTDVSWAKYFKLIVPVAISIFIRITIKDNRGGIATDLYWMKKKVPGAYISVLGFVGDGLVIYIFSTFSCPMSLVESVAQAALITFEMVFSKKIVEETGIHHANLVLILGGALAITYLPIWAINFWYRVWWTPFVRTFLKFDMISAFLFAGVSSWLQTIVAFTFISSLSTHCYIAASACNRIFRICTIGGIIA